jgi:hypothetical protein
MAVADFSLPAWLNVNNTDLLPRSAVQGAEAGQAIAQGIRAKQELEQRLDQQKQAEQEKAKIFAAQQSALADYKKAIEGGMKQTDALAKYGPGLFAGNPAALATSLDRERANEIRATYEDRIAGVRTDAQKERERYDRELTKSRNDALDLKKQAEKAKEDAIKAKNPEGFKPGESKPLLDPNGNPVKGWQLFWNGHDMVRVRTEAGEMTQRQYAATLAEAEKLRASYEENKGKMTPEAEAASRKHLRQLEDVINKSKVVDEPSPVVQPVAPTVKPSGPAKRVPVINPDGTPGTLPEDKVQDAVEKYGFKLQTAPNGNTQ